MAQFPAEDALAALILGQLAGRQRAPLPQAQDTGDAVLDAVLPTSGRSRRPQPEMRSYDPNDPGIITQSDWLSMSPGEREAARLRGVPNLTVPRKANDYSGAEHAAQLATGFGQGLTSNRMDEAAELFGFDEFGNSVNAAQEALRTNHPYQAMGAETAGGIAQGVAAGAATAGMFPGAVAAGRSMPFLQQMMLGGAAGGAGGYADATGEEALSNSDIAARTSLSAILGGGLAGVRAAVDPKTPMPKVDRNQVNTFFPPEAFMNRGDDALAKAKLSAFDDAQKLWDDVLPRHRADAWSALADEMPESEITEEMVEELASKWARDDVWMKTGWVRDPNGENWLSAVDDSGLRVKPGMQQKVYDDAALKKGGWQGKVGDVYEGSEAMKYSNVDETPLTLRNTWDSGHDGTWTPGSYDDAPGPQGDMKMWMRPNSLTDPDVMDEQLSVIAHEGQHHVANQFDMPQKGASPDMFYNSRLTPQRSNAIGEQIAETGAYTKGKKRMPFAEPKRAQRFFNTYGKQLKFADDTVEFMQPNMKKSVRDQLTRTNAARKMYDYDAGEAYARATQAQREAYMRYLDTGRYLDEAQSAVDGGAAPKLKTFDEFVREKPIDLWMEDVGARFESQHITPKELSTGNFGGYASAEPKMRRDPPPGLVQQMMGGDPELNRLGIDAREYPQAGPPELRIDKKKGTEYLGKLQTPEEEAIMAARSRAQKRVDAGDYEPFFDTTKRRPIDRSQYPAETDPSSGHMPTQKMVTTKARLDEEIGSPENIARVKEAYQAGLTRNGAPDPDAPDWYFIAQLEDEYVKELGPKEGRKALGEYLNMVSATTAGTEPEHNFRAAHYANQMHKRGLKAEPEASYDLPASVGGGKFSMKKNFAAADKMEGIAEIPSGTNPKRHDFKENFLGNANAPVMDDQMGQVTGAKTIQKQPDYAVHQQAMKQLAGDLGVTPQKVQEVVWNGWKKMSDKNFKVSKSAIQEFNEIIARTAMITGETQEKVVKRIVNGKGAVWSLFPVAAGGGALGSIMVGRQKDDEV